jgi:hypothetical protein
MARIEHKATYWNQFIGKAGEHAVASQLFMRGINVYFPAVDTGVDLVAEGRIRIQVKTRATKRRDGYPFCIASSRPRDKEGKHQFKVRDWSECADFLICWAAPENRFWIIPTVDLVDVNIAMLCLGFTPHWKYDHDAIREMKQAGISGVETARQLGCSTATVSAVLNGRIKDPLPSFSTHSGKYENAWNLIDSALGLTREVDSISEVEEFQEKEI